jgi:carboxyl-terminal processing protease
MTTSDSEACHGHDGSSFRDDEHELMRCNDGSDVSASVSNADPPGSSDTGGSPTSECSDDSSDSVEGHETPDSGKPEGDEAGSLDRPRASSRRKSRRVWAVLACVTLLVVGFFGGYLFRSWGTFNRLLHPISASVQDDGASGGELARRVKEVEDDLSRDAYDPPDLDTATDAAVNALLEATGDQHSEYYTAEEYESYQRSSSGNYVGIGIVVGEADGKAVVTQVYADSPAESAGIQQGDVLLGVDDDVRDGWSASDFVAASSGEEGTSVTITWRRPATPDGSDGEVMSATVERRQIKIPNVSYRADGDIGYIKLSTFNQTAGEDVKAALEDLEGQGVSGYVLDLRNNTGGYLTQAVEVASLFQESGTVVEIDSRTEGVSRKQALGDAVTDKPVVVLVNEYSASASEIVASSLHDNGRATLVGIKAYGKGTVQAVEELSYGGAIRFTTAHYLTANGEDIDGAGVMPDVVVEMDNTAIGTDDDEQYQAAKDACANAIAQAT